MLDLLKNIWKRDNQSIDTHRVRTESLKREKDQYELEISLKVCNDPDYKDITNTIQEKEREVTKLLNALDTLYTCRATTVESLEEKYKEEIPFSRQEEWDNEFVRLNPPSYFQLPGQIGIQGYTGPTGPTGTTYPASPFNTYTSNTTNPTIWPGKKKQ